MQLGFFNVLIIASKLSFLDFRPAELFPNNENFTFFGLCFRPPLLIFCFFIDSGFLALPCSSMGLGIASDWYFAATKGSSFAMDLAGVEISALKNCFVQCYLWLPYWDACTCIYVSCRLYHFGRVEHSCVHNDR